MKKLCSPVIIINENFNFIVSIFVNEQNSDIWAKKLIAINNGPNTKRIHTWSRYHILIHKDITSCNGTKGVFICSKLYLRLDCDISYLYMNHNH